MAVLTLIASSANPTVKADALLALKLVLCPLVREFWALFFEPLQRAKLPGK